MNVLMGLIAFEGDGGILGPQDRGQRRRRKLVLVILFWSERTEICRRNGVGWRGRCSRKTTGPCLPRRHPSPGAAPPTPLQAAGEAGPQPYLHQEGVRKRSTRKFSSGSVCRPAAWPSPSDSRRCLWEERAPGSHAHGRTGSGSPIRRLGGRPPTRLFLGGQAL